MKIPNNPELWETTRELVAQLRETVSNIEATVAREQTQREKDVCIEGICELDGDIRDVVKRVETILWHMTTTEIVLYPKEEDDDYGERTERSERVSGPDQEYSGLLLFTGNVGDSMP